MNEALSDSELKDVGKFIHVPTSNKDEIDGLAGELADNYVKLFTVDTKEQQQRFEDSLEECLTHLEEVCSVLDSYRHTRDAIPGFVEKLVSNNDMLNKIYEQVDALEQYIFTANQLLDQLDTVMKDLEKYKGSNADKLRRLISRIPGLSLSGMPNFLGGFNGLMEETVGNAESESSVAPINEILAQISSIDASFVRAKSSLDRRIKTQSDKLELKTGVNEDQVDLNSAEGQVDGSWQELL